MRRSALLVVLALFLVAGCEELLPPPAAAPGVECVGMPAAICQRYVDEARRVAEQRGARIVSIRLHCTAAACTEASGEGAYEIRYSDGSSDSSQFGWAAPARPVPAGPAPTPPVAPVCAGVPAAVCADMATGIDFGGDPANVVSIVVRCRIRCTPTSGEGETVVTLRDGRRLTSNWTYEGGP